jgi:copper chaperone
MSIEFDVKDMSCGHCVAAITRAVATLDPAAVVQTDLATHRVSVQSALPVQALKQAIEDAGYAPVRVGSEPPSAAR